MAWIYALRFYRFCYYSQQRKCVGILFYIYMEVRLLLFVFGALWNLITLAITFHTHTHTRTHTQSVYKLFVVDCFSWIYSTLPDNKQMVALSATYPEYMADHLTVYMRNPTFIRLNISDPTLLGSFPCHTNTVTGPEKGHNSNNSGMFVRHELKYKFVC